MPRQRVSLPHELAVRLIAGGSLLTDRYFFAKTYAANAAAASEPASRAGCPAHSWREAGCTAYGLKILIFCYLGVYEISSCFYPQFFDVWAYIEISCKNIPSIWLYTKKFPKRVQILLKSSNLMGIKMKNFPIRPMHQ